MSTYPNIYSEPELLKKGTRDDENSNLIYQTEKHIHENILKIVITDNEFYKKKYKKLNKKKIFMIVSEILIGVSWLTVGSGLTISGLARVGITCAGVSFLFSISTLITNEYFSRLKIRYTKLSDWIIVTTLPYEKTLKDSVIDKKIDEKEAEKLKSIYNHYINKRSEIKKSAQSKVEEVFDNFIPKDIISTEQITKLNNFFAKTMWI